MPFVCYPTQERSRNISRSMLRRRAAEIIRSPRRRGRAPSLFEAERLCSLEIDYQLVLGRRLHGEIGGLLAEQKNVGKLYREFEGGLVDVLPAGGEIFFCLPDD